MSNIVELDSNGFIVVNNFLSKYIDENFNINKKYKIIKKKKKLFKSNKSQPLPEPINIYHAKITKGVLGDKDINLNKWVAMIQNYIIYLRYAEKCYMYNNSEDNYIYSEILNTNGNNLYNLYYNWIDCKNPMFDEPKQIARVKVSLDFSKIPKIDSTLTMGYLLGEESNEVFCNIEIKREYGKKMVNEFHWMYNNDLDISDDSDNELLLTIISVLNRSIIKQFNNILLDIVNTKVNIFGGVGKDWRNICNLCIVEEEDI